MVRYASLSLIECEQGIMIMNFKLPDDEDEALKILIDIITTFTENKDDRWVIMDQNQNIVRDVDYAAREILEGKDYFLVNEWTCIRKNDLGMYLFQRGIHN